MVSASALALSLALGSSAAARVLVNNTIKWFPCPSQNGSLPLTCGSLFVPLDYEDTASNATLELQLVKVSATKQPKKGSILFNPGGPGGSGRDSMAGRLAEPQLIATGGVYDLIGFDPRGTGNTIPFSCYNDSIERAIYSIKTPVFLNASDTAVGASWAARKTLANSCYKNAKDVGELIGTGYVARDMMQIVDALNEDGLLRFWGFSYGTALGATVAAMFPDRMDKIVLDGVLNPHDYYAGRDVEQGTSSDDSFDGFFTGCVANPERCTLAQDGTTAQDLKQKVYALLETLKYQPVAAGPSAMTDIIDYHAVKLAIFSSLYDPQSWPSLANGLHGLLTGNLTAFLTLGPGQAASPGIFPNYGYEAPFGIRSSDVTLRTNNLTSLYPLIEESYAKSNIFGDWLPFLLLAYAQWPFKAKGAYTGDFRDIKTRNPLLFVGSRFDAFTPLVSAQNASAGFVGSVVLEHGGYGHTSYAQPSLCTYRAIRAYFVDGTLPSPGTRCEPDIPLFANQTLLEWVETVKVL